MTETTPAFQTKLFINNEYIDAKCPDRLTIHNPTDEALITSDVHVAGEQDVDDAVAGARAAFKTGPWSTYTAAQRGAALHKIADLLEENAEHLGQLEHMSMGQPPELAAYMVSIAAGVFRYYAGWADKIAGESFPADDGTYKIVRYEPLGVCAAISAWNASITLFAWKVAPALAAGNTVVFKSSEKTPLGILSLGTLILSSGLPAGVIQLLSGGGPTGALLAAHMGVQKISFTGSAPTGRRIQAAATASNMKRVTLELGGKSPALVFPDADLDNAVTNLSAGFLLNSGQVCAAASRTYVHEDIADAFLERLKARFEAAGEAMRNGDGKPFERLGPLADRKQFERVMAFVEGGKGEARLVTGGARAGEKGYFVLPTIFAEPREGAGIYKEEIFGPVSTVRTFREEKEVIEWANDTSYGLSASVYTSSISRALRVAAALEAGSVSINAVQMPANQTPFGGYKQSGQGRELGREGLMAYLQTKTIAVNMAV